ncbi:hypothetical protein [Candidatus Venteria ishoeyi]|uniref:hypothetical protein n=1 Tax=Candidatus Venteria ishoeyi TaxID=1899563 RepID=UPI0011B03D32|nr:hypothetical protein [Candidatus Venteria ishoeyi]
MIDCAIIFVASKSSPESISSKKASFESPERRNVISDFFCSQPELPLLNSRSKNSSFKLTSCKMFFISFLKRKSEVCFAEDSLLLARSSSKKETPSMLAGC